MLTSIIAVLLSMLGIWIMLSSLYWHAARPALQNAIRYRLFAKRDSLRRLAIENQVRPESFVYKYLERRLCYTIRMAPGLNLYSFLVFSLKQNTLKLSEMKQFEQQATKDTKKIWLDMADDFIFMLLANAPIASIGIILFVKIASLMGKHYKDKAEEKAMEYVEYNVLSAHA